MKYLTMKEVANYLEATSVEQTSLARHTVINIGINEAGVKFVMLPYCCERTAVPEGL